eukprot:COSAG06_NODE_50096_length_321_cov_0.608108_1_plen_68_part_10
MLARATSTGSGTHKETLLGRLGVHAWPLQYRPAGAFATVTVGTAPTGVNEATSAVIPSMTPWPLGARC